ncbi:MAG TPA: DEAD/DEAH box helicase [Acetobacteraceae bacterium]
MNMLVPVGRQQPSLTDYEIIRATGRGAFHNGDYYVAVGRVRQVTISEDGSVIEAETQGSARRPYGQHVVLRRRDGSGLEIRGICTCPVGFNCKHIAAALIAARRKAQASGTTLVALSTAASPGRAVRADPPMPLELGRWLNELNRLTPADTSESAGPRQQVIYVLSPRAVSRGIDLLEIQPFSAYLRKTGETGSARLLGAERWSIVSMPAWADAADRIILNRLYNRRSNVPSPEDDPPETLRRVLDTGRARWMDSKGVVLSGGSARAGRLNWRIHDDDGSQGLTIELDGEARPIRIPAPWYIEPDSGQMGPIILDIPQPVVGPLLAAPPIPALQSNQVREELLRRFGDVAIPMPAAMPPPEVIEAVPVPCLRLMAGTGQEAGSQPATVRIAPPALARLSFRYGPVSVGYRQAVEVIGAGGRFYRVARADRAESEAAETLMESGFRRLGDVFSFVFRQPNADDFMLADDDGSAWLGIMIEDVPRLRRDGWEIIIDADFPLRVLEVTGDVTAELEEGSGIDWLELHLGVVVEGERLDLVPGLVRMIAATQGGNLVEMLEGAADDAPFVLPLPDGRLLSIPLGRIRTMLFALSDLFGGGAIDAEGDRVGFSRLEAADLAALESAAPDLVWQGGEILRTLGRQLREAGGSIPSVSLPAEFRGVLRPYQAQGLNWLQFLAGAGMSGVLADDMGLGKTVQTLAHLSIEKEAGRLDRPALIVCPTSLVANWALEAERFAPALRVLVLHGPERKQFFAGIGEHDVVITSYKLISRDEAVLTAQEWHVVVLDEAQTIKNPLAETTRLACSLKARHRLCLSGTPLENHLGELWSLFNFLSPGFLGSAKSFRRRYRMPIEKHGDESRRGLLARRVRPFLLRRTKEDVAPDLPPKTEMLEPVELEAAQRAIYDSIRMAMHARVRQAIAERGLARSGIIILDALLKMRQACCDPRLLKMQATRRAKAGSAKLERLMELLTTLLEEGRRVLVFSQFTSMLSLIIPRLDAANIPFALLTGDTVDRQTPIRRFQSGEVPVFLLSLKAGGTGLNLTAADTVIHYDPWWNPSVENQATDRAHRIGQDKPVFVYRLVATDTIEQKMELLKARKRALVAGILEAERGGALRMTEADIELLFG